VFPHLQASALGHPNFQYYAFFANKTAEVPMINIEVVRPFVDDLLSVMIKIVFQWV
jgi:hypothetical protein